MDLYEGGEVDGGESSVLGVSEVDSMLMLGGIL